MGCLALVLIARGADAVACEARAEVVGLEEGGAGADAEALLAVADFMALCARKAEKKLTKKGRWEGMMVGRG